jgi:processive 1,2-diacylglycerol beta-glucosyltransferase
VDLYLVPSTEVRRKMVRLGVTEDRIRVTGIPVDLRFAARGDRRAERSALGLAPHRPTVLVMGGNYGLGPLEDAVHALRRLPLGLQLVVVCGNNRALLRKMNRHFGEDRHVRVLGLTRSVHRLMDAADLLISKPGGLTTSEALAKGLPMVMIEPIPDVDAERPDREAGAALPTMAGAEKQALVAALKDARGTAEETAARLGMSRVTFFRKLKKHGLKYQI